MSEPLPPFGPDLNTLLCLARALVESYEECQDDDILRNIAPEMDAFAKYLKTIPEPVYSDFTRSL